MFLLAALLLLIPIVATLQETIDSIYEERPQYIPQERVDKWTQQITSQLEAYERRALDRERLIKSLHVPPLHRDGTALVDEIAQKIASVVASRTAAAIGIAKKAEKLEKLAINMTDGSKIPLPGTTFNPSVELDKYKSWRLDDRDNSEWRKDHSCRGYLPMHLERSSQFSAKITRLVSSAHVPVETYDCDDEILSELNRTEKLDEEFKKNYGKDATFSWQYYCSARGFLRHYPGAAWDSMAGAYEGEEKDLYDCRMRAWYIEATGAPRDILVLLDSTGSMSNLTQLIAHELTRELFTALTDDDHVNVIRFQRISFSSVPCFENVLVPANHINVAALLNDQIDYHPRNFTSLPAVLRNAVRLLNESRQRTETPPACQQAIVLLTDLVPDNYTALMRELDPEGRIRVFAFMLGVGKMDLEYAENLVCESDGYFAQLQCAEDASEQARKILRVLERPAVLHHQEDQSSAPRFSPVWGDLYAHVQDTRFAINRWRMKEKAEQKARYMRLRRDKVSFLSPEQRQHDYEQNEYKTTRGRYSEEEDPNTRYQLMISVSVPVYDPVEYENVTVKLMEELQRDSTREERVARLLGVAGVDLPLDDLRLRLPYHKLGPGGSLILLDHRGNAILHDDLRPVVDGNILKNGYRTVDLLDVELLDADVLPRNYGPELVRFREAIMSTENGVLDLSGLVPYDGRRRAMAGQRRYFWRRVKGTGYTAVVSLPITPPGDAHSASRTPESDRVLTREVAADALRALNDTDFYIQPDWLYCRYVENHFSRREDEILHFLQRISEEPDFSFQKLHYSINILPPGLLNAPYFCDEELMARLAWEARKTSWFSSVVDDDESQSAECALGSSTIFFTTVGGLTRWRHRVVQGDGPSALLTGDSSVARASAEPWYRRAAAVGPSTLILHAGVANQAPVGWLTAARALRHLGVTGFHFKMAHLGGLLTEVTAPLCDTAGADCELTCSSEEWDCILIDEAGWVLADTPPHNLDRVLHLTTAHPAIMKQLLEAKVFQKRWLYDYQGTCFSPKDYGIDSAPRIWPLIHALFSWSWLGDMIRCMVLQLHYTIEALMMLAYVGIADADTEVEQQKRKVRVRKDFNRQQWEKLYSDKVLINKTLLATCDRRRAIYSLRADAATRLAHQSVSCGNWSMVAALVPRTNMMLLVIYTLCYTELKEPLDDPMDNLEVPLNTTDDLKDAEKEVQLACERHIKSAKLLARGPAAICYPHSREQEWEFRKCDQRVADKESAASFIFETVLYLFCACIAVLLS